MAPQVRGAPHGAVTGPAAVTGAAVGHSHPQEGRSRSSPSGYGFILFPPQLSPTKHQNTSPSPRSSTLSGCPTTPPADFTRNSP